MSANYNRKHSDPRCLLLNLRDGVTVLWVRYSIKIGQCVRKFALAMALKRNSFALELFSDLHSYFEEADDDDSKSD